jgi:hypothetical protein
MAKTKENKPQIGALYDKLRRDGADLLTPAMLDAGVLELLSRGETREEPAADIIRGVFQAIAEAAPRFHRQSP